MTVAGETVLVNFEEVLPGLEKNYMDHQALDQQILVS